MESLELQERRWKQLKLLQLAYPDFPEFMEEMMIFLGFQATDMQKDIASFMESCSNYSMVQAQRGQAKTSIAACFAVWNLIHNPKYRVLVVSAAETLSSEISTLIVRIITTHPNLSCLRPDTAAGDRSSVQAFDVHHTLKGVDKSPSVACVGITSSLPGKRADLILADDCETEKNSETAVMRERILQRTKEFSQINQYGKILYLGTPQNQDSLYNTLPARGCQVRIWTGRYPTKEQLPDYGEYLAPYIKQKLEADPSLGTGGGVLGDQGKPTDPQLYSESTLRRKEIEVGKSNFALQYMLNTKLLDRDRYPLKPSECVLIGNLGQGVAPLKVTRAFSDFKSFTMDTFQFNLAKIHSSSKEVGELTNFMYIDPAGKGGKGDNTAYSIGAELNTNIFIQAVGGLEGGYETEKLEELALIAKKYNVRAIQIEKNFGYGAFTQIFAPILRKIHPDCGITEDMVSKQKELRIIDTLEPVINAGQLIFTEECVKNELANCTESVRELFFQMAKIHRKKDALAHDDLLDSLAGLVNFLKERLNKDKEAEVKAYQKRQSEAFIDRFLAGRWDNPEALPKRHSGGFRYG